ncbi:MAG: hypothetical protein AAGJ18_16110 [Bacteroidota bacterium]
MTIGDQLIQDENGFFAFEASNDDRIKGMSINSTIYVSDANDTTNPISGNFLIDLGGANALYLNLNQKKVKDFVEKFEHIVLDPASYASNSSIDMKVLAPQKIKMENLEVANDYIIALKIEKYGEADLYTGMIGIDFLERYEFIFDYHHQKMYFKNI